MSRIGSTYGQSLYALALEENLTAPILAQMDTVRELLEAEPKFVALLTAANLPREERIAMLDSCFQGRVEPYLLNFLRILTEKGIIRHFGECCDAYRDLYNADNGILWVSVLSAVPLREEQCARLKAKLDGITGKNVQLNCRVDEKFLGGIRLDYDGKRIDGTIAGRLASVAELLKNAAF